jgi:hypothetical protein
MVLKIFQILELSLTTTAETQIAHHKKLEIPFGVTLMTPTPDGSTANLWQLLKDALVRNVLDTEVHRT